VCWFEIDCKKGRRKQAQGFKIGKFCGLIANGQTEERAAPPARTLQQKEPNSNSEKAFFSHGQRGGHHKKAHTQFFLSYVTRHPQSVRSRLVITRTKINTKKNAHQTGKKNRKAS